jgi:hypothetical protein
MLLPEGSPRGAGVTRCGEASLGYAAQVIDVLLTERIVA